MAEITDKKRLQMYYNGQRVVDISADFLATNGVKQHTEAVLTDNRLKNPFADKIFSKQALLEELSSLNVTCQKGLASKFRAAIESIWPP